MTAKRKRRNLSDRVYDVEPEQAPALLHQPKRKRPKREPSVWVVEMLNDTYRRIPDRWEPCSDAAIERDQAREKLAEWRAQNSGAFRLSRYRRVPTSRKKGKR